MPIASVQRRGKFLALRVRFLDRYDDCVETRKQNSEDDGFEKKNELEDGPGTEHPVVALVWVRKVGGLGVRVVVVEVAVGLNQSFQRRFSDGWVERRLTLNFSGSGCLTGSLCMVYCKSDQRSASVHNRKARTVLMMTTVFLGMKVPW